MKKGRIVHVGQNHGKEDSRILKKECASLSRTGYCVSYITSDQHDKVGEYKISQVKIILYPYRPIASKGKGIIKFVRLVGNRFTRLWMVYRYVKQEKPQIVHIHEYKLLYLVILLRVFCKDVKIIYDVHEDTPRYNSFDYYKRYGGLAGKVVEKKYEWIEHFACKHVDAVIVVTPHIYDLLKSCNKNTVLVCNYPIIEAETTKESDAADRKEKVVSFGGGLCKDNGIETLLCIQNRLHGRLALAGRFADIDYVHDVKEKYHEEVKTGKIQYYGYLTGRKLQEFYISSTVGSAIYKNTPNSYYSYPIKLFEYMEKGIPVVASNFPGFSAIVNGAKCGFTVDPENETEIIEAFNRILDDPELAKKLGENGRRAVLEKYNWKQEEEKLLELYNQLMTGKENGQDRVRNCRLHKQK